VARDADGVALLERVGADEVRRDLAGDADDGHGIHHGVRESRHRVGGAGTRGHEDHADLAGRAGVALGGVHCPLLVADEHVLDGVLMEERVIDRKHRAARIAEHVLDPLILEGADHHLGAGHRLGHLSRSVSLVVSSGIRVCFRQ
jgi:hypothetical protein